MGEIKKIVRISDLKRDIVHRKLFCLAVRRLPVMFFLYVGLLFVFALSIYGLIVTREGYGVLPVVSYVDFIALPVLTAFIVLWVVPFCIYNWDLKRASKIYGESYESVSSQVGFKAEGRTILWNAKKIIKSKYGIAVISFNKIVAIFPVNGFTPEEYKQLQVWMRVS